MYYTIGGFTLDDTVLPSGEVRWAAPGGNALYSAIGARLWDVDVGIVASVGEDYPEAHLDLLRSYGFDLSGVRRVSYRSFHVWILHEGDGRRQILYRLDSGTNDQLDPVPDDLPGDIARAQGVHICPILGTSQGHLMAHLAARKVPLFLDLIVVPNQIMTHEGHRTDLWPELRAFLPSYEEVIALWGERPETELLSRAHQVGSDVFAVKMGARGSVIGTREQGVCCRIPACQVENVVDATGAGDAYCGGFMVGLQETGDVLEAALRGTVSASFVIEGFGALHALAVSRERVQARLDQLRDQIRSASPAWHEHV